MEQYHKTCPVHGTEFKQDYFCEDCGNIVDRDFNASKNILAEGLNVLYSTVGHTGSNACGEDKVHFSSEKKKKVVFVEAGKRITPVVS